MILNIFREIIYYLMHNCFETGIFASVNQLMGI